MRAKIASHPSTSTPWEYSTAKLGIQHSIAGSTAQLIWEYSTAKLGIQHSKAGNTAQHSWEYSTAKLEIQHSKAGNTAQLSWEYSTAKSGSRKTLQLLGTSSSEGRGRCDEDVTT